VLGVAALLLHGLALGQEAPEPEGAEPPPVEEAAPRPSRRVPPPPGFPSAAALPRMPARALHLPVAAPEVRGLAEQAARAYLSAALAGDARRLADDAGLPFHLEARRIDGRDELFSEWLRALRHKRVDQLQLEGLEVLTPEEMERRHGKPPARLASLPWRAPGVHVVVANVSGRGVVLLTRLSADGAEVIAFHD
jgi:hypothetical protein